MFLLSIYADRQWQAEIKDVVWEHGENLYLGWRCNYCHTQKGGGGATRLKQHLAGRGAQVIHCRNVPPNVREYFQRDIERAKKATADRARERLRRQKAAVEENNPGEEEDEEAQVQRGMDLSRAEAEFRRGWNREEVHMSVEGVVVRRGGMLCGGCFEGPLRRGRDLWWRTITWQLVGEEE